MALRLLGLVTAAVFLSLGCASHPYDIPLTGIDRSRLPPPDTVLQVKGLSPCTDRPDRSLLLNSKAPVIVLIHGSHGSPGKLRGLAQALADRGEQPVCFSYDDRASLNESSAELASSIRQLTQRVYAEITILGHSQGALVARKAVTDDRALPAPAANARLHLITVSGPFAGIEAARRCGSSSAKILSLGIVPLICELLAGDKWADITYSSEFIKNPGRLRRQVRDYLKIDTDERNTCRDSEDGHCIKNDYVFTLEEQHNTTIDQSPDTQVLEIKAGHAEIIGSRRTAPVKLISALEEQGIVHAAEPVHATAFDGLMAGNTGAR